MLGREAVEAGERLEADAREIKSLLDGIDTSMDEDDVSAVRNAEYGYSADFKSAFREEVETKEAEMERIEGEASDSASEELGKVKDAEEKLGEMARITDIGRRNAESAADRMRSSAAEYEEFVSEAESIIEDTKKEVESLKSSIESIFG